MMRTFALSQLGASHLLTSKPCQDASLSVETADYAMAIVADGHGGEAYFRSDRGSLMAVEAAQDVLTRFLISTDNLSAFPADHNWQRQLAAAILTDWQQRIEADYRQDPFDTDSRWQKAYGTTLIAVVRTQKYLLGLHIGDGRCVAIDAQGTAKQPIPWDKRCFLNRTTSMCDVNALNEFRFCILHKHLPKAVFVGTDGVEDCFADNRGLYDFYKVVLQNLTTDFEQAVSDLRDYLPQMSQKGSKDDISIAGIV